ncbi:MAG: Abi family protein [Paramuribaculum sp.]|nr:Abi family protein [Paramuribaculum sp.]
MAKLEKKALTIQEQIELLASRGMEFDNIPKAEEILGDIGYYRFGFFSFPFEKSYPRKHNRTHELVPGTTFKQVHDLYMFDSQLRHILTTALTRIEINIRTRLTLMGSLHFIDDPWWFCNPKYISRSFISKFDREVYSTVMKNPTIQEHHKKHTKDKYAPAWKTMEFMTLGNIVILFEAIKDKDLKDAVAKFYNCSIKVFLNYLETIRLIRNRCAHGGCLYNLIIKKGINKLPANVENIDSHNIKGAIEVILHFLGIISKRHRDKVADEIRMELAKLNESPKAQEVVKSCANLDANF